MDKVLVFRLGAEYYGLEIAHIQEVIELPPLHYIPRAAEHFLGAVNVHGSILPVLDLAVFLGFDSRQRDHRIIVLTPQVCRMALAVTALEPIVPLNRDSLLPAQQEPKQGSCIRAVLNLEAEMINLLDTEGLLARLETV